MCTIPIAAHGLCLSCSSLRGRSKLGSRLCPVNVLSFLGWEARGGCCYLSLKEDGAEQRGCETSPGNGKDTPQLKSTVGWIPPGMCHL